MLCKMPHVLGGHIFPDGDGMAHLREQRPLGKLCAGGLGKRGRYFFSSFGGFACSRTVRVKGPTPPLKVVAWMR